MFSLATELQWRVVFVVWEVLLPLLPLQLKFFFAISMLLRTLHYVHMNKFVTYKNFINFYPMRLVLKLIVWSKCKG